MLIEKLITGDLGIVAAALGLVVLTVVVHALGIDVLLRAIMRWHVLTISGLVSVTRVVSGLTCWLLLIHLVEISVWGLFYFWQGCLPDVESALYFSGVTYTSTGYGDLLLPKPWRMLAPVEALTGILMCGLSAGLFFAIISRWISSWVQSRTAAESHSATPPKTEP